MFREAYSRFLLEASKIPKEEKILIFYSTIFYQYLFFINSLTTVVA